MIVTYRYGPDSDVTAVRRVHSIADCDRELLAVAELARYHRERRHLPGGHDRAWRNMLGLADALLTARWELQLRDDLELIRGAWWRLPGEWKPAWPAQSSEAGEGVGV